MKFIKFIKNVFSFLKRKPKVIEPMFPEKERTLPTIYPEGWTDFEKRGNNSYLCINKKK